MKTLIVTGGSLDISWAKDFVRTINAEYIIAADSGLKYIDELGLVPDMILGDYDFAQIAFDVDQNRKITAIRWYYYPQQD